jgi:hypothetical protein
VVLHFCFQHDKNPDVYNINGVRGFSVIKVNLPERNRSGDIILKLDEYGKICRDEEGEIIPESYNGQAVILQVLTVDKVETPKPKRQYVETIEINLSSPFPAQHGSKRNPGFGSPGQSPRPHQR